MFTQFELEVLETLWKENQPLTKAEIVARSPNQTLKPNSMAYILKKLQEKGAVEQSGVIKELHHFTGQYVPTITREDYFASSLSEAPDLDFVGVFSALNGKRQISKQTLAKLKEMIEELEKTAEDE